ncbi:MAG: hypothetical protein FJ303_08765 [Planctomycetes bacterium]|nr:hypothetical protein [Planctomycetota bacterium]
MSAVPAPIDLSAVAGPLPAGVSCAVDDADAHDQFVVAFGKCGALGVFASDEPLRLRRNDKVAVQTSRGLEVGTVLCRASIRQARLLGVSSSGILVRVLGDADRAHIAELSVRAQAIFTCSRDRANNLGLAIELLDVDVLLDGQHAIVQFVGDPANTEQLAHELEARFTVSIRFENLAGPRTDEHDGHGGCGKPDCGRTDGGGGCSTCETGGCSSCGVSQPDLRDYFSHLRAKMEESNRIPLK